MDRAEKDLNSFETNGEVASFFYAALELRFEIEARLHAYIKAAFASVNMKPPVSSEYVVTKLMRILTKQNPGAGKSYDLNFISVSSGQVLEASYTAVIPSLAAILNRPGIPEGPLV